jgi:hypothetical protein
MKAHQAGIFAIIFTLWAGCSKCPDGRGAGNSVGCGNPIKTAELQTLSQNTCGSSNDCAGAWPRTLYRLTFDQSLTINVIPSKERQADSVKGTLYLFEGDQIPVFDNSPVDSVVLRKNGFVLTDKELAHLRKRGGGDSSYSAFSAYVRISNYFHNLDYSQAGLLAGLVFDWNFGSFSYSERNPLAQPDSTPRFGSDIAGLYQGSINIPDTLLNEAGPLYVYVSGSPFFTQVDGSTKKFLLDSLPLGEAYELRFFAMPITDKHGVTAPVFRLETGSGTDSTRVFELRDLNESVTLP